MSDRHLILNLEKSSVGKSNPQLLLFSKFVATILVHLIQRIHLDIKS